ncbi:U2 protein [Parsley severe stunt associated virus]|uniref:U2 protein n=1 Tax=Parsley severe stunt associated virus TaxID=2558055 RepID=A0A482G2Z7_9VIRU|nr:U2 protein [Parsley severe stunt associated virus]QBO55992.1 U2 protein [Parsley severe stunt associated virus]
MSSLRSEHTSEDICRRFEIKQLQYRQDVFWNTYEDLLHFNEDIVGEFCKKHGRRVLKYPLMPAEAPCRLVHKQKTVYDIRVEDCIKCINEENNRRTTGVRRSDVNLRDLYDYGNYRYKVFY